MNHLKFSLDRAGYGTVEIDGQPVEGLRATRVRAEVNEPTVVELEYVAIAVEGEVEGYVVHRIVIPGLADVSGPSLHAAALALAAATKP